MSEFPDAGQRRVRRRRVHLPGRRVAGAAGHQLRGRSAARPSPIVGSTGAGKTTLDLADPAAVRRDRRRRARRRRRRARGRPRLPLEGHRPRAAAPVPVLRHGRLEPALRPRGGDGRGALEGARDRAGHGLRRGDGGAAERAHRAGRHERLRRSASAARDRARDHPPARHPRLRRLVLRARPVHRRPARQALWRELPGGDQDRRRPARLDDHGRRPDRGARRRAAWWASARTRSSWRRSETYREIVESQLGVEA